MTADTVVRARISGKIKSEATHVLDSMGLSVSDAVRMLLVRVAREKALPFDATMPNAETHRAMSELNAGSGRRSETVASLIPTSLSSDLTWKGKVRGVAPEPPLGSGDPKPHLGEATARRLTQIGSGVP